jgi:regulatory protein
VADAYLTALTLLGSRELSELQLRTRLRRRKFDQDDIDETIARLKADGALNDRRVALAAARLESTIRHRGRARVLQKIRQLGIEGATAESVVTEVFADVDETAILDRALARRLRGQSPKDLDEKGRAKIVRALVGQGFSIEAILKRMRLQ